MAQKSLDPADRSEYDEWNESLRLRSLEARRSVESFGPYTSCHTPCRTDFSSF
jgi:hypothetical protein